MPRCSRLLAMMCQWWIRMKNTLMPLTPGGLRVWGASGDRTVRVSAFLSPPTEETVPPDLIICAVKARFIGDAANSVSRLLGPDTCVLTIQNGLGSAEIMAQKIGGERLMVGVAQGFGASLPEPGCAHHNDMKAIRIGAYANIAPARVAQVAQTWAAAGFDADTVDDIVAMQWAKLICNVAYSAPCAITGMTVGGVMDHPQMSMVSRAAAREAYDVARTLNIKLRFDDPEREIREFAGRMYACQTLGAAGPGGRPYQRSRCHQWRGACTGPQGWTGCPCEHHFDSTGTNAGSKAPPADLNVNVRGNWASHPNLHQARGAAPTGFLHRSDGQARPPGCIDPAWQWSAVHDRSLSARCAFAGHYPGRAAFQ